VKMSKEREVRDSVNRQRSPEGSSQVVLGLSVVLVKLISAVRVAQRGVLTDTTHVSSPTPHYCNQESSLL